MGLGKVQRMTPQRFARSERTARRARRRVATTVCRGFWTACASCICRKLRLASWGRCGDVVGASQQIGRLTHLKRCFFVGIETAHARMRLAWAAIGRLSVKMRPRPPRILPAALSVPNACNPSSHAGGRFALAAPPRRTPCRAPAHPFRR